jgi:hypothetical protein
VNKNIERCRAIKYVPAKENTLLENDEMLKVDCMVSETHTNLLYPLQMRIVHQVSGMAMDQEGFIVMSKPHELEQRIAGFGEKGKFDWNGKKREMYAIPCYTFLGLKKIDENTTLHTEILVTDPAGWLSSSTDGSSGAIRRMALKSVAVNLSTDCFKKYRIVFSKIYDKKKKVEDYKDVLEKEEDQGRLLFNLLFP